MFATFVAAVVCYDVWFYALHRLLHVPWVYHRYHYQHHQHHPPTLWDAFEGSHTENLLGGLGVFVPVCVSDNADMAGFFAAFLFCFVRGVLRHDPRAVWLVGSHHLQHHADPSCNYSSWYVDTLMGTKKRYSL